MTMARRRILHAIHDFLPRHRAGSEIYAAALAAEQARRHDVFVLAAEYDPTTPHGTLRWRAHDGLPVVELVNNWAFTGFDETYRSPRVNAQLTHVLEATQPDVLHVHNLLNLSFDLPRLAGERGVPSVATLHDYTLVCASGGQRVHAAESHVCDTIDAARCSRCFMESPFHAQMAASRLRDGSVLARGAVAVRRLMPLAADALASRLPSAVVSAADITRRLACARHVFDVIDVFVAPSAALADEYARLGLDRSRIEVSDYGFARAARAAPQSARGRELVIGFVGTLVWHKGVHVLIEAARRLTGPCRLRIHGDPSTFPRYSDDLRRQSAGIPVVFEGAFGRDELARVYSEIDVLVVPSLWPENSPLVIHEAFMHGVPVVGARRGGIPGLVSDGVNGVLYDGESASDLARVLQAMIDDRAMCTRLAAGVPAVKSIEQDAREWDARYDRLLCDRDGVA